MVLEIEHFPATEVTKGLTDYERHLAEAYIGPGRYNPAESARIAGGSVTSAKNIIERPRVQAYIALLKREWNVKTKATAKRVLQELEYIALSDITDIIQIGPLGEVVVADFSKIDIGSRKAIRKITLIRRQVTGERRGVYEEVLSIELHDKNPALRTLTKDVLGMGYDPTKGLGDDGEVKAFGGLKITGPKQEVKEPEVLDFLHIDGDDKRENAESGEPSESSLGGPSEMELLGSVSPSDEIYLGPEAVWD